MCVHVCLGKWRGEGGGGGGGGGEVARLENRSCVWFILWSFLPGRKRIANFRREGECVDVPGVLTVLQPFVPTP